MPLNEIPKFFHPEIRHLIDFALEDAWQELRNQDLADAASVRGKLATTIVALAAIGETDPSQAEAVRAARCQRSLRTCSESTAQEASQESGGFGLIVLGLVET